MKKLFSFQRLITGLFFILIFLSGCIERPISEISISPQYPPELSDPFYPISINEGIILLNSLLSEQILNISGAFPITYIYGREVNREGKAEQWIFGTRIQNDNYFVLVESNRQVLVPYPAGGPETVVDMQKIIMPDSLIAANIHLIRDAFGKNESFPLLKLELTANTYSLTPSIGGGNRILYFNAFTGKLLNT